MWRAALLASVWLAVPALAQPAPDPALAQPAPDPAWTASVVGFYAGSVRNEGRMECHRTVFSLRDGKLVGHYWIDSTDPFEGELTGFVPASEGGGRFTWTDRYGEGVEAVVFAADGGSFTGTWGDTEPEPGNPVWGVRGGTAACARAVSDAGGHPHA